MFTSINISNDNLDVYIMRSCILNAIESSLSHFNGNHLDIGCGSMPYRSFILKNSLVENYQGVDIEDRKGWDKDESCFSLWDGEELPFSDDTFDSSMATEVLEHISSPESLLLEAYRILKPGGLFFFTVPFLWNFHEIPHDEYRYTPYSLKRHLTSAGFYDIELYPTGGWHASMGQMLGLWVKRAPMSEGKRKLISNIFKPIIKRLYKMDLKGDWDLNKPLMVPGIYGRAWKPLKSRS